MAKETKASSKSESFEQLYGRLESTVAKLEEGGLPLEDAIALYEEGMTLARACQGRLDNAEQRITRLKESFAPVPRSNGVMLNDANVEEEIEYVPDEDGYEESAELP